MSTVIEWPVFRVDHKMLQHVAAEGRRTLWIYDVLPHF